VRYKFLSDLLVRSWDAYEKVPLRSFFIKELKKLSQDDLRTLVSWWLKCFKIKTRADEVTAIAESVAKGRSVVMGEIPIRIEVLSSFLTCISLSESRMANLISHPQDLKFPEMKGICKMVRLPEEKVQRIDSFWKDFRPKVLVTVAGKTRKIKSRQSLDNGD
jgi:hypothetical protein